MPTSGGGGGRHVVGRDKIETAVGLGLDCDRRAEQLFHPAAQDLVERSGLMVDGEMRERESRIAGAAQDGVALLDDGDQGAVKDVPADDVRRAGCCAAVASALAGDDALELFGGLVHRVVQNQVVTLRGEGHLEPGALQAFFHLLGVASHGAGYARRMSRLDGVTKISTTWSE